MSYSNIFATYKIVTPPPRRRQKWEAIPQEDNYNPNLINFMMPSAIPASLQQESVPQEDIQQTPEQIPQESQWTPPTVEFVPEPLRQEPQTTATYDPQELIKLDIEDLLRQEGITSINGKEIHFGSKELRSSTAKYGVKRSHHKERDPHTGHANARDISIRKGTDKDYADFRRVLLGNDRVRAWFQAKNWGIINELTREIMNDTNATGRHFHFGPDQWARKTWRGWMQDPEVDITKSFKRVNI